MTEISACVAARYQRKRKSLAALGQVVAPPTLASNLKMVQKPAL
jgi:hypothetical protein